MFIIVLLVKNKGGLIMLTKKEEENIHGFTGDIKDLLRKDDFESALILIDDLKKYILELEEKDYQERKHYREVIQSES